jgi:hypothetical protein
LAAIIALWQFGNDFLKLRCFPEGLPMVTDGVKLNHELAEQRLASGSYRVWAAGLGAIDPIDYTSGGSRERSFTAVVAKCVGVYYFGWPRFLDVETDSQANAESQLKHSCKIGWMRAVWLEVIIAPFAGRFRPANLT